jgi:integrase/recombinase XerD
LDDHRKKNNGNYPLKLRVYCNTKAICYSLIYEITKANFDKLKAKHVSPDLSELKEKIKDVELNATVVANQIVPFDFEKFHDRFVYKHPLLVQRKRGKKNVHLFNVDDVPEDWKKRFHIFGHSHPSAYHVSSVYLGIIKSLLFQGRVGTAASYHCSYTSLIRFRGNIQLSDMTARFLKEYESWMLNELGNSKTSVGINTRCFRAVINEAIELKLFNKEDYPFGKRRYKILSGRNIKKALDKESISKLYYTPVDTPNQQKAKDFWFFSFYGNGMNVKDIICLKYKNIQGEYLVFERAKTELTSRSEAIAISCFLNEDMLRVIEKYGNEDKSPDNYIFPVFSKGLSFIRQDELKRNFIQFINKNMAKISKKAGIGRIARTMETRHSSATNHLTVSGLR